MTKTTPLRKATSSDRLWARQFFPVMMVMAAGIALTIRGYTVVERQEENNVRLEFEKTAESYRSILQDALSDAEEQVASVADLFAASGEVDMQEFRIFTGFILDRHPGLWAVSWFPRVPGAEREAFEQTAQEDIFPRYSINELNHSGELVLSPMRGEYFPILYFEPADPAERNAAFGFDPMSNPVRRLAFETARDTGRKQGTAPIQLVSTSGDQPAISIVLAIYHNGVATETTEQRRKALKGYITAIFRVSNLVESALLNHSPRGMDIYFHDTTSGSTADFLYFHSSRTRAVRADPEPEPALRTGLHLVQPLDVAGRNLTALFRPAPGFYVGSTWEAMMVLFAGLLLTGLLALYQCSILAQNIRISSQVAIQTKELLQNEERLLSMNDELSLERDKAETANRTKSEFLTAMSHELRTPLNAVIGFSEMIGSQTFGPVGDDRYREYAGDIHGAGIHLLELINDVLDLAKVEAGSEELHEQDVDIGELQRSVLSLVQGRAGEKEIHLEPDIQNKLPLIHADLRKLKQILVNLLSNAIKFNDHGGTVTLKVWHSKDGFVFQVIDTGIGMTDEDIPKALSRFGQVDGDISRNQEGTGLGLPLTKALVELHGGSLDLQSRPEVGTTVTVRFPFVRTVVRESRLVTGT